MAKEQFTMNMDKEVKKTLKMIALQKETTVTDILMGLVNNFLEVYDEKKDNFSESINYSGIYKQLELLETNKQIEKDMKTTNKIDSSELIDNTDVLKRLEKNGIEINDEGMVFTETFFNQLKISGKEIGEYIDERKRENSHTSLEMPLKK